MPIDQTQMTVWKTWTEYERAANYAHHIWEQSLLHADVQERFRYQYDPAREDLGEAAAQIVGAPGVEVAFGDILSVHQVPKKARYGANIPKVHSRFTQREVAGRDGKLYQVVSVSPSGKSVQVIQLIRPGGSNWDIDMTTLALPYGISPERMSLESNSRDIVRLGTREEILGRIAGHPDFQRWSAAHQYAKACFTAQQEEADVNRKAANKERDALKVHVDAVNTASAMRLLEIGFGGKVRAVNDFLAKPGTLDVFLAGLAATGHMGLEGSLKAADALKALRTTKAVSF